jgi:processive 1,2-diacylglycerol beta-glucosyltransferase
MNNPKKQKLLLISCSGGMGHIRAAEALKTHAEKYYPEITCEHFNAAEYSGWFLNTSLVKTYEFLIKNHPKVFGALFKLADTTMGKKYIELHHPLLRKSGEPLIEAIERFGPDRIIVTHPIIMPLLEKLSNPPPIDVVVTDYYANQIWLHPNIRHLFGAIKLGRFENRSTVFGISETFGHRSPDVKNIFFHCHIVRIKITDTFVRLRGEF